MTAPVLVTDAARILTAHVEAFNNGVRTGDWSEMLAGLTDDAEMTFIGVPAGPFYGREAIGEAYRNQPPDDTMTVLDVAIQSAPARIVAGYAWDREPRVRAGELHLGVHGGHIASLTVTFTGAR